MAGQTILEYRESRQFGIHSAIPSRKAFRLSPQLVFLPARVELYRSVSARTMHISHTHNRLLEPLSLDEANLDATSCPNYDPSAS